MHAHGSPHAVVVTAHLGDGSVGDDVQAFLYQKLLEGVAHFRLIAMRQEFGTTFQERDVSTEAVKHLSQFQRDIAATYNE